MMQKQIQMSKERPPLFTGYNRSDTRTALRMEQTSGYFAPLQTTMQSNRTKEMTNTNMTVLDQKGCNERFSLIHNKLQQEAEKIRRWKVQTEMELKQKDQTIQESKQTGEVLRKSIFELQVQNENLSLKLQEELESREQIRQKINSTEELCNVLKEQSNKIDEKLSNCETDQTKVKYLEEEHLHQFEDLNVKFEQLQLTAKNDLNLMTRQLEITKEEKENLEEDFKNKLELAELELEKLTEQCQVKTDIVKDISGELEENKKNLSHLEHQLRDTQNKLTRSDSIAQSQASQLQERDVKLQELTKLNETLQTNLDHKVNELKDTIIEKEVLEKEGTERRIDFEETNAKLQQQYEKSCQLLADDKKKIQELEEKYEMALHSIEELKCDKDTLITEKSNLESQLLEVKDEKEKIEMTNSKLEDSLNQVKSENAQYNKDIVNLEEIQSDLQKHAGDLEKSVLRIHKERESLQKDMERLKENISEKEASLESVKTQLNDACERETELAENVASLKSQLESQSSGFASTTKKLDGLSKEKHGIQKELTSTRKELTKMKKDLEKFGTKEKDHQQKIKALTEESVNQKQEILNLQNKISCLQDETKSLEEQGQSNSLALKSELDQKSKATSELESKSKSLKGDITNKNKQIKELEKETKSLKKNLDNEIVKSRKLEDNLAKLQDEISKTVEDNSSLKSTKEEINTELEKSNSKLNDLNGEIKQLKLNADKVVKEKNDATVNFDGQMKEMARTLEKYNQSNQEFIHKKDTEIDELKIRIGTEPNKMQEKEIDKLTKRLTAVQSQLDVITAKKDIVDRSLSEMVSKTDQLVSENADKETRIGKLNDNLLMWKSEAEKAKELLTRSPVAQSTPIIPVNSHQPKTPVRIAAIKTPKQVSLLTPQRSILKPTNSVQAKKRRVVFASDEEENFHSDSSTSELMEVELDDVEKRIKKNKPSQSVTPLVVRPSPMSHVRQSPAKTYAVTKNPTPRTPLKPVSRGPSISIKKKSKNASPNKLGTTADELKMFKNLFDGKEHEAKLVNSGQKNKETSAPKWSGPGRIFKTPQKERKLSLQKKKRNEVDWFDNDAVFGFEEEF